MTLHANDKAPGKAASKPARKPATGKVPNRTRPMRKKDQLIRLLSARSGATALVLAGKLGWQAHTVRAALSGLRKAGYEIVTQASAQGGATRYRIIAAPSAAGEGSGTAAAPTMGAGQ